MQVCIRRTTSSKRKGAPRLLTRGLQSASDRFRRKAFHRPVVEATKRTFNFDGSLSAPIILFTLLNHLAKRAAIAIRMRANDAGARRLPDLTVSFSIVCTLTCESRIGDIR